MTPPLTALPPLLDLAGIAVFALSGALLAAKAPTSTPIPPATASGPPTSPNQAI